MLLVLTRRMTPRRDAVDALAHAARGRGVAVREIALEPLGRRELEALVGEVAALAAPQRERVVAAADGNPLLALESARAAGARRADGRRPRCAAPCAPRSPGSTSPRAAPPSSPPSPAARSTASSSRRWPRPRRCSRRSTAACSAAPTGASASATTCCARPRSPTSTTPAARSCTRRSPAPPACAPPRPRATCGSRAATTSRSSGSSQAAADAAQATALVEAVAYLQEAIELRPDDPRIHVELAGMLAQLGRREPAMAEIDAALRLLRPDDARPRVQHAPQRRAVVPQRALRSDARAALAQRGLDAYEAGGLDDPELRGEMLLIRGWSEVVGRRRGRRRRDARRARRARRSRTTAPSLRRHYLDTVVGFNALAEGRLERGRGGAGRLRRGRRARRPRRPRLRRLVQRRLHRLGRRPPRARATRWRRRGEESARGIPTIEFQMAGLRRLHARPPRAPRRGARRERPPGRARGAARLAGARAARRPRRRACSR